MYLEISDPQEFIHELQERKIKQARIASTYSSDAYITTFKIRLTAAAGDTNDQALIIFCELVVGSSYNLEPQVQELAAKTKATAEDLRKKLKALKIDLKPGSWKL